jgi:hypothetical protein
MRAGTDLRQPEEGTGRRVTAVAPGVEVYVPLRVVANGDGSELTLTLFRQPQMSDDKFEADSEWVQRDLATLKRLLEA